MLTLVLWPAITIERLITGDFIMQFRLRLGGLVLVNQASAPRPGHALRPHQAVELLGRNIPKPHGFFAQRRAVLVRGLGDLGGLVVADLRRERRDQDRKSTRLNSSHMSIS